MVNTHRFSRALDVLVPLELNNLVVQSSENVGNTYESLLASHSHHPEEYVSDPRPGLLLPMCYRIREAALFHELACLIG